jgi:hypothetical protein
MWKEVAVAVFKVKSRACLKEIPVRNCRDEVSELKFEAKTPILMETF